MYQNVKNDGEIVHAGLAKIFFGNGSFGDATENDKYLKSVDL